MLSTHPIIPVYVYLHGVSSRVVGFENWVAMVEHKQNIWTRPQGTGDLLIRTSIYNAVCHSSVSSRKSASTPETKTRRKVEDSSRLLRARS